MVHVPTPDLTFENETCLSPLDWLRSGHPPEAAAELAAVPPALRVLPAGTRCWHIHFQGGRHPGNWDTFRAYGPTSAPLDHHLPPPRVPARRVLYVATRPLTCFAEVFQDTRTIDRQRRAPWLVAFELVQPVPLLDLTGRWPTQAGASMAINSGPRPRARRWSQAIYAAYPHLEGLHYASSMNANAPAIALYERAAHVMPGRPVFHRARPRRGKMRPASSRYWTGAGSASSPDRSPAGDSALAVQADLEGGETTAMIG